ncbi:hypothetical protein [Sporichthya sp.]|uniref:hypothetical protein n=1 Tax=Sporichthya sp. TaxID=65475 RepID=UPI0018332193|nr:hypothetical protein [Sporichthya sp.]MBA3744606.1 hypothetical protein [Sporichthya sp.]
MDHSKHSYFMIGLLALGAALFFSGVTDGGALFLLWPIACMAMMFFMMRGMGGMQRGRADHEERRDTDATIPEPQDHSSGPRSN